jgi:hypothetical protein
MGLRQMRAAIDFTSSECSVAENSSTWAHTNCRRLEAKIAERLCPASCKAQEEGRPLQHFFQGHGWSMAKAAWCSRARADLQHCAKGAWAHRVHAPTPAGAPSRCRPWGSAGRASGWCPGCPCPACMAGAATAMHTGKPINPATPSTAVHWSPHCKVILQPLPLPELAGNPIY